MTKFLFIICLILLNPLSTQATEEICLEFDNEFQPLTINDDSRSTLQSSNEDSISDRDIDETDSASPIEDENLLEETPPLLKNIPILKEATVVEQQNKFFQGLNSEIDRLYKLKIDQTNTASSLFKEPLTKHFKSGPLETFHPWAVMGMTMESHFEDGDNYN